jgi:hypothetical protein
MTRKELNQLIKEELAAELASRKSEMINEAYDLEDIKYSSSVRKQVEKLVDEIQKTSNLSKPAVASILNDVILALGLNRTQITMYMNMIKMQRKKYDF